MKINCNFLRFAFVFFIICTLTGCFTINLSEKIKSKKYYDREKVLDSISYIYVYHGDGKYKDLQFKGRLFSYDVDFNDIGDIDNFLALLGDSGDITIKQSGKFELYLKQNERVFYGEMDFIYSFNGLNDDDKINNKLSTAGFKCVQSDFFVCSLNEKSVRGNVSDKLITIKGQRVIQLQKPLVLSIEENKEITPPDAYALMLLYPIAIIGDILTSPVQIIFIPMMVTSSGK